MTASPDFTPDGAISPHERVTCEHADLCGGCPLIGLPYAEQLALKREQLVTATARYAALDRMTIDPVIPAAMVVGYRARAKLIVAPGGKIGLFARGGGHEVVDIPRCKVLTPSLGRVANELRARVASAEVVGSPLASLGAARSGWLRAVDLREAIDDGQVRVLVTFVVERVRVSDISLLRRAAEDLMRALPEVVGVAASFHRGEGPQVLGSETVILAGSGSVPDRAGSSVHLATFGSFVQAHRAQTARLHAMLAHALGTSDRSRRGPRVLDLYGGSGSVALALAAAGASVRLVESFGPAAAQARAAARTQGADVEAEHADVANALNAMVERRETFDAVVVNPPRRGTTPLIREQLARLAPAVIAYVSCDPETLARDLDHLGRLGYRAEALQPIDMIPLTDQVETLALLRRSEIPAPRILYEDDEVLVVEKEAHEPTAPQGEHATSLLARVRRIAGAERAVPIYLLDVGTSGLVMLARRPEHVARWAQSLGDAGTRKLYLAGVRGITPLKGAIARALLENGQLEAARTRYRRIGKPVGQSLLRVQASPERTHQIRRHFAAIGHPLLGDHSYGHAPTNRHFEEKHGLDRTFLHCARLEITHPVTRARLVLDSPLPGDLRAVIERRRVPPG